MVQDLKKLMKETKKLTLLDLHRLVNSKIPMCDEHIAAKIELERRASNSRFWRTDVWAWLGFLLAVVSLLVSLFKNGASS